MARENGVRRSLILLGIRQRGDHRDIGRFAPFDGELACWRLDGSSVASDLVAIATAAAVRDQHVDCNERADQRNGDRCLQDRTKHTGIRPCGRVVIRIRCLRRNLCLRANTFLVIDTSQRLFELLSNRPLNHRLRRSCRGIASLYQERLVRRLFFLRGLTKIGQTYQHGEFVSATCRFFASVSLPSARLVRPGLSLSKRGGHSRRPFEGE